MFHSFHTSCIFLGWWFHSRFQFGVGSLSPSGPLLGQVAILYASHKDPLGSTWKGVDHYKYCNISHQIEEKVIGTKYASHRQDCDVGLLKSWWLIKPIVNNINMKLRVGHCICISGSFHLWLLKLRGLSLDQRMISIWKGPHLEL